MRFLGILLEARVGIGIGYGNENKLLILKVA